jgi:hypothetical protein
MISWLTELKVNAVIKSAVLPLIELTHETPKTEVDMLSRPVTI